MKTRRIIKRISLLLAALLICALLPFQARAALADWYDYTGDGAVDSSDAIYLLRHVLFPADFPLEVNADLDRDGVCDSADAIYLLRHVLFPADFPLCDHDESMRITDSAPDPDHDGVWHTECMECGAVLRTGTIERIAENGEYTSKDDVALYLHVYGKLPGNFITKAQAKALGWKSGDLWKYAPGKSLGGDVFENREGLLPDKEGRVWYECDIDYQGGARNSKRIVWSNDGLIYYSSDHYASFTQLY